MGLHYTSAIINQYTDIADATLVDLTTFTLGIVFRITEAPHSSFARLLDTGDNVSAGNGSALQIHDGSTWATVDLRWFQNGWSTNDAELRAVTTLVTDEFNTLFITQGGVSVAPHMYIAQGAAPPLTEAVYTGDGAQVTPTGTYTGVSSNQICRIAGRTRLPSDTNNGRVDVQQMMFWSDAKSLAQCQALRWAPFGKWRQSTSLCQVWLPTNAEAMNFGFSAQPSHTGTPTQADSPPSSMPFGFDEPWIPGVAAVGGLSIPVAMHSYRRRRVA